MRTHTHHTHTHTSPGQSHVLYQICSALTSCCNNNNPPSGQPQSSWSVHTHTHTYACTHKHTKTHTNTHTHTHTHTHKHTHTHTHTYACTHKHTKTHTNTHTHTHTPYHIHDTNSIFKHLCRPHDPDYSYNSHVIFPNNKAPQRSSQTADRHQTYSIHVKVCQEGEWLFQLVKASHPEFLRQDECRCKKNVNARVCFLNGQRWLLVF